MMKKTGLAGFMIVCVFFLASFQPFQNNGKHQGDLTVIISGLKNDRGNVKIGLFNTADSWNDKAEKFKGAVVSIKNRKAQWVIRDIPYGQYAIKFFHDENNDDKIKTNFLGMPTETYGFYKSGATKFIPPGFDKAKFSFESGNMQIEIEL